MSMNSRHQLDAVIIGGDVPDEYLGKDVRERTRLSVEGYPASLRFLERYFAHGRDADAAQAELVSAGLPFISLNAPYLQAYLLEHGLNVEIVPLLSPYKARFAQFMQQQPRAVVISTTFLPFATHIDKIAATIKQMSPNTTIIAGGIQVWKSFKHKQLLDDGTMEEDIRDAVSEHNFFTDPTRPSPVDVFVVSSSGESTLTALLKRLRNGNDYSDLPNLAIYANGGWQFTPQAPDPYHEVKMDWSAFPLPPGRVYVPVQAGEGCGFQCTFCDFRGLRPIHLRTAQSIVDEVRTIPPTDGIRRVYFTDDNLFSSRKRARDICRAIMDSGMRVRWRGMVRISIVDEEIAALMAESGCLEVLLGIESGDPGILKNMGKSASPEQILAGLHHLTQAGINTKSTFIVGYPGETEATLQNTVDLLNAYPTDGPALHRYLFFRFGVLPLSRVASPESRERFSLRGYGYDWTHATMTSDEAASHMEALYDRLKVELSPNYVLEVPELPGMDINDLRRTVVLRNHLARRQRGIPAPAPEADLWNQLEGCF